MDEKEYEVTIREVLEKKVRYRGRNELEATAKAEADYYAEKIKSFSTNQLWKMYGPQLNTQFWVEHTFW